MRKVYVDATLEVPVLVRVQVGLLVRADDDADVGRAVKRWAKGRPYAKADVELNEQEIVAVDGLDHSDDYTTAGDWLEEAVQERLGAGAAKLLSSEVTDSK